MDTNRDEEMTCPGHNNPSRPIRVEPSLMHLDEQNFLAAMADHRGEPKNLFPHFVAIAALIAIIVICIF
jgi:hypothetical protein